MTKYVLSVIIIVLTKHAIIVSKTFAAFVQQSAWDATYKFVFSVLLDSPSVFVVHSVTCAWETKRLLIGLLRLTNYSFQTIAVVHSRTIPTASQLVGVLHVKGCYTFANVPLTNGGVIFV